MSEGVNETAVSLVVVPSTATTTTTTTPLQTTLESIEETKTSQKSSSPPPPPSLSPTKTTVKTTHHVKKVRKHATTGRTFHLIDGKRIRSALTHKKWPPRDRRVSFPINDNELVTGYLEPANPWEHAENVNIEDLISSYKASCQRHGAEPLENLLAQLEKLDISDDERCPELSLKNECLDQYHCEPLEELLKRVQFEKIDVESSSLDDESATILFDMLEYYQSVRHLNMSSNRDIGSRGWQACAQMIKKTTCLEQLEAKNITLTQQHMNILKRPLQLVSHLRVLKLENCGLAGRAFGTLVSALKLNTGLKELYLADNRFEQEDAIQLGALLRVNNHLQLLDISNNNIKDEGVRDLLDGLIAQSGECRNGKGLSILVLWNNDLTRSSSSYFSEAIAQSITLETLNIGKNPVGNEMLELAQEALIKSQTLLQLGMQSTSLTCKGALLLAGIIERNRSLQRIDLRDNNIQMEGLAALSFAVKRNPCVTQLDLDPTPWSTKPATMDQYRDLVAEIRTNCTRNDEQTSTDDSTEESGSPQHRSRLSSVSSRKISLTCQTLPRSPPSIAPNSMNDITTRSMLEPKRTSGGRLRSPAPSPIPSPVASPIPSPSRGRFVVSRVSENSLSSTNSSASSSPVTPSSLGSSPTSFFPPSTTSVSSRFRVTVVEPKEGPSKSLVTRANTNITIGFDYKVEKPENSLDSEDSDSVFRSDGEEDNNRAFNGNERSPSIDISMEEDTKAVLSLEETKTALNFEDTKTALNLKETKRIPDNFVRVADGAIEKDEEILRKDVPVEDDQRVEVETKESGRLEETESEVVPRIKVFEAIPVTEARKSVSLEKCDVNEGKKNSEESLRDEIMACYQSESKKSEAVPRQATSLERLLGLFQNPGSLFSTSSYVEKTETKNPLQDGVNSMIALGDKFQQYLRDGRSSGNNTTADSHRTLQRSVSDASRSSVKSDPVKSLSIPQLSCIRATCIGDFGGREEASPDSKENTRERFSGNFEHSARTEILGIEENSSGDSGCMDDDRIFGVNKESAGNVWDASKIGEKASNDENAKSLFPDRGKSCVDIGDNSSTSLTGNDPKTSVKLVEIPEYSVLVTMETSQAGKKELSLEVESSKEKISEIPDLKKNSSVNPGNDESSLGIENSEEKIPEILNLEDNPSGNPGKINDPQTSRTNEESPENVRSESKIEATVSRDEIVKSLFLDRGKCCLNIEDNSSSRLAGNDSDTSVKLVEMPEYSVLVTMEMSQATKQESSLEIENSKEKMPEFLDLKEKPSENSGKMNDHRASRTNEKSPENVRSESKIDETFSKEENVKSLFADRGESSLNIKDNSSSSLTGNDSETSVKLAEMPECSVLATMEMNRATKHESSLKMENYKEKTAEILELEESSSENPGKHEFPLGIKSSKENTPEIPNLKENPSENPGKITDRPVSRTNGKSPENVGSESKIEETVSRDENVKSLFPDRGKSALNIEDNSSSSLAGNDLETCAKLADMPKYSVLVTMEMSQATKHESSLKIENYMEKTAEILDLEESSSENPGKHESPLRFKNSEENTPEIPNLKENPSENPGKITDRPVSRTNGKSPENVRRESKIEETVSREENVKSLFPDRGKSALNIKDHSSSSLAGNDLETCAKLAEMPKYSVLVTMEMSQATRHESSLKIGNYMEKTAEILDLEESSSENPGKHESPLRFKNSEENTPEIPNLKENPSENPGKITDRPVSRTNGKSPENVRRESKIEETVSREENVKSLFPDRGKSALNIEDNSSSSLAGNDLETCAKLAEMPKYSVLVTMEMSQATRHESSLRIQNSDEINNEIINCDSSSSTTDSINDPSFKVSSHYSVKCDILSGSDNVHTIGSTGDVHNFSTTSFDRDNTTIIKKNENPRSSVDESSCDPENLRITSPESDEIREPEKREISNISISDISSTILNVKDSETGYVDKLPNHEESSRKRSENEKFPLERFEDNSTVEIPKADTIEEFLPIENNPPSSVRPSELFANDLNDRSSENNSPDFKNNRESNFIETDSLKSLDEKSTIRTNEDTPTIIDESPVRISKPFVQVPSSSVLKSEFAVARIAITSIDDDDYVPVSIEQVSSSLSEDSGYSGKLLVDDPRNCNVLLNDSTVISPGNETTVSQTSISDNRLDGVDKTRTFEERISFVSSNVESTLTFLNAPETRNITPDVSSNESNEDLIFKITDIDGATVSKETTKPVVTKIQISDHISSSVIDCYYESEQSTSGNLFIERSRNVHRNSQDSGIEETTASITEENGIETMNQQTGNFQESLDSGIDSESSSVCARNDLGADISKERARDPGKNNNSRINVDEEITRFTATSRVEIDDILGNKDIGVFEDSSTRIMRIVDDDINVAIKVSDVVGNGNE